MRLSPTLTEMRDERPTLLLSRMLTFVELFGEDDG
ncbi:hypothetical protein HRbin17_02514 [bacterium HR17]|uniref:Uncharacterized protein n=1 Tax=Candidatus Fervidibacter japonicus TaxID=2035412 RepID=A0A2H5XFP0_9BACT|nr:hypothetical protein HRbin17_02514 [bacterium HR17]